MRRPPKIVSLASALAALGVPAAAPPAADAAETTGDQSGREIESGTPVETQVRLMDDGELMRFTVHRVGDNMMFPQHGSHSSHSSHASHASSSTGGGGSYWPNPVYVPSPPVYAPAPIYAPPAVVAPPVESSTAPPPEPTADPKYVACTRAFNGVGATDIASELQQNFGMSVSEAQDMAEQALTAKFAGTHYCDGYLGDHE